MRLWGTRWLRCRSGRCAGSGAGAEESVEQVALRGDVPVASEVDDVTAEVLFDCSLVVVILAVIPWWHYVWQHYAGAHGDR